MNGLSNRELVTQVLEAVDRPLTVDELVEAAGRLGRLSGTNPKQAVRNALSNNDLLQPTSMNRPATYVYLPRLLAGSTFCHQLSTCELQAGSLEPLSDLRLALVPTLFRERPERVPVRIELPDGHTFSTSGGWYRDRRIWGLPGDDAYRHWLQEMGAQAGDALLVHLVGGSPPCIRLAFEPRAARNRVAVAAQNKALGDEAEAILQRYPGMYFYKLTLRLLATGVYGQLTPPDPLDLVLYHLDTRFKPGWGFEKVTLATPLEQRLLQPNVPSPQSPTMEDVQALLEAEKYQEAVAALRGADLFRWSDSLQGAIRQAAWYRVIFEDDLLPHLLAEREGAGAEAVQALAGQVYRFKVALTHRKSLWRRIEVRGDQRMYDFDQEIRDAFGHDSTDHLSEFYLGGGRGWRQRGLGVIYPWGEEGGGENVLLGEVGLQEGDTLRHVYDFGDDIRHDLRLEAIVEPEAGAEYPRIVAQNKPRYRYCQHCREEGKKTVADWVCIGCSNLQGEAVLICEACAEVQHEEHYVEEMIY